MSMIIKKIIETKVDICRISMKLIKTLATMMKKKREDPKLKYHEWKRNITTDFIDIKMIINEQI